MTTGGLGLIVGQCIWNKTGILGAWNRPHSKSESKR